MFLELSLKLDLNDDLNLNFCRVCSSICCKIMLSTKCNLKKLIGRGWNKNFLVGELLKNELVEDI